MSNSPPAKEGTMLQKGAASFATSGVVALANNRLLNLTILYSPEGKTRAVRQHKMKRICA